MSGTDKPSGISSTEPVGLAATTTAALLATTAILAVVFDWDGALTALVNVAIGAWVLVIAVVVRGRVSPVWKVRRAREFNPLEGTVSAPHEDRALVRALEATPDVLASQMEDAHEAFAVGDRSLDDIDPDELNELARRIDEVQELPEGKTRNWAALALLSEMHGDDLEIL